MGNEAEERTEHAVEPPGQRLRLARESAGMSQSDVAAELRLGVDTIDALEHDAIERLPAPIFVRGYLRNYALLLGLPAPELVRAYDASIGRGQAEGLMAGPMQQQLVGARRRNYLVWLLVLAVALVAAWWFQREGTLTGEPAISEQNAAPSDIQAEAPVTDELNPYVQDATPQPRDLPPAAEPVTPPPEDVPDASPAAPLDAPASAQPAVPQAAPETSAEPAGSSQAPDMPATASEAAPAPAAAPEAGAAGDTLMLVFQDRSWVEVRDARGERLLYRLANAGESRTLRGQAPFRLVLGNAPAVRVELNGSEVDVAAHTRGRTARFSVAP